MFGRPWVHVAERIDAWSASSGIGVAPSLDHSTLESLLVESLANLTGGWLNEKDHASSSRRAIGFSDQIVTIVESAVKRPRATFVISFL